MRFGLLGVVVSFVLLASACDSGLISGPGASPDPVESDAEDTPGDPDVHSPTPPGEDDGGGGSIIIDPPATPDAVGPADPDVTPADLTTPEDTAASPELDALRPPEDTEAEACPDYTKDPVLMVHGYGAGADITFRTIRERLIEDCWPPEYLYAPDFDDILGCNPEHGEEIAVWVRDLKARTGRDKVDILAFSMGALDARYYIKYLCGYRHVRDFVSLAGANHGSFWGCNMVGHTCGGQQMCRGLRPDAWRENPFLADLNDCDETPGEDILYMSIWSPGDEIVLPPESAILDGARNIQLEHPIGHAGSFLEEEPYHWIKIGLDGGGENNNLDDREGYCYRVCPPGL